MPILGDVSWTQAQVVEAIGSAQNELGVSTVALLGTDDHSILGYGGSPLLAPDDPSAWVYSYERWFRVRLTGSYQTVRAFRIWCSHLVIPSGWEVHFGTASAYQQPTNSPSAIATRPVPTSDPGPNLPNAGGLTPVAGPGTTYSDWIVLQARGQGAVLPGPVLGFDEWGQPVPIAFEFHWIEVD